MTKEIEELKRILKNVKELSLRDHLFYAKLYKILQSIDTTMKAQLKEMKKRKK